MAIQRKKPAAKRKPRKSILSVYSRTIEVTPFASVVKFHFCDDIRAASDALNLNIAKLSGFATAFTFTSSSTSDIHVFWHKSAGINSIAHECVHVVNAIMNHAGAEFEEEVWAYYMGWIVEEACRLWNKVPANKS